MIRILVCFKVTSEYNDVAPEEWARFAEEQMQLDFLRRILGCFDEAALENALRLKECYAAAQQEAEITAVTVSAGYCEHIFSWILAAGVDKIVHIEASRDLRFAPDVTAQILADFVLEHGPYDLIFAGKQAPVCNSGMVPFMLAEYLSLPCASEIIEMKLSAETILVLQKTSGGIREFKAKNPFVAVIGNATHSYLRLPTLRDKLKITKIEPEIVKGTSGASSLQMLSLNSATNRRKCRFTNVESLQEEIHIAYENDEKGLPV